MKYLLYYIFFIIIIITFAYINSLNGIEGFTPKIKEMYRPYLRHTRLRIHDFIDKQKIKVSNFMKKLGVI